MRTAELLKMFLPEFSREDNILKKNKVMQTALHVAFAKKSRQEVAEYLCSLEITNLLVSQDAGGNTVLHNACTEKLAKMLVTSVKRHLSRIMYKL